MRLEELERIRRAKHLTRSELSAMSGVSWQCIEALEKGRTNVEDVKLSTLIKLATTLKVRAKKLLPVELQKRI